MHVGRKLLGTATSIVSAALLLGATCSPSEPGCPYSEECAPDEEVRTCINFCAPVYQGDLLEDVLCPLDPCDAGQYEFGDVFQCPSGGDDGPYRCDPFEDSPLPDQLGRCVPARPVVDTCDPDRENECATGAVCLETSACPEQAAFAYETLGVPEDARGFCWLPRREGEPCTGNVGDSAPGCEPCEAGTWCRDTTYGPRCLRSCSSYEDANSPQPELCGCSSEGDDPCRSWEEIDPGTGTSFHPQPGEPQFYCTPPRVPNGHRCDPEEGVDCADPLAVCQLATDPLRGLDANYCCRSNGESCEDDVECCLGRSTCTGGVCQPCGRENDTPEDGGCCFGYTLIDGRCRSCSTDVRGRQRFLHEEASCDGSFITFEGPDGQDTLALPVSGGTAASPADLPLSSGQMQRVTYNAVNHEIFLLQGNLSAADPLRWVDGPIPWGSHPHDGAAQFVQLPANKTGSRTEDLTTLEVDPSSWESVRVYHGGACSRFIRWQPLLDGLALTLNTFLVDPNLGPVNLEPLSYQDAEISVRLANGTGPFGRSLSHDEIRLRFVYSTTRAIDCTDSTIEFRLRIRLNSVPATVPTADGEFVDDEYFGAHSCDSDLLSELELAYGDIEECSENCYGYAERRFDCISAFRSSGVPTTHFRNLYRSVRTIRTAQDVQPEIVFLDGGVDTGCAHSALNHYLREQVRSLLDRRLGDMLGSLLQEAGASLPDASLGYGYDDLPLCGRTHPITGEYLPSQAMCAGSPIFGGHRTRCVGFDSTRSRVAYGDPSLVEYRCADTRVEIRRANIRPDGLEIVLADSVTDPQFDLVQHVNSVLCGPDRDGRVFPDLPPSEGVMGIERSRLSERFELLSAARQPARRRICSPDDILTDADGDGFFDGCVGICGDVDPPRRTIGGINCADALIRGAIGDTDVSLLDRCFVGRDSSGEAVASCCPPANFCPTMGGGLTFSAGTFRCVSDFDSDERACGDCTTACSAGDSCCDGACVSTVTSSTHCGGCGRACSPGTECCGGGCVDLSSSTPNCGACGAACPIGSTCTSSICCAAGTGDCDADGVCEALDEDPENCGACGNSCPFSTPACVGGECQAHTFPMP